MFKDRELALQVQQDLLNILRLLDRTAYSTVKLSQCPETEYDEFIQFAQSILAQTQSGLFDKISVLHPELKIPNTILSKQEREPRQNVPLNPDFKASLDDPPLTDRNLLLREQEILLSVTSLLDYSVGIAKASGCAATELDAYAKVIGKIMGYVFESALDPIWGHHPELMHPSFRTCETAPRNIDAT